MKIHTADSLEKLEDLDANAVHAVITDPPYGLAFMGRDWDDFEPKEYQEWCEEWAEKAKQVLKPGGHLLAFSGNRTHHRLFTGVEDAGFEIRDTLTWHYGSGFPKASDISKTIDKRADAERETVKKSLREAGVRTPSEGYDGDESGDWDRPWMKEAHEKGYYETVSDEPATDAAKKWDGWKTGLKPATEFVVMARKPYDGATVDSVLENGTGALNIDACRVEGGERPKRESHSRESVNDYGDGLNGSEATGTTTEGRYPANVVFDETEAENIPSRYFYTSKASRSERTENGSIDNSHPTVKPIDLMEWLVKLVTRENQIVLDPFCGSGTTGKACKSTNREFIGIEQQAKWADVARVRCGLTPEDPSVVRGDANQQGLEQF